MSAPLNWTIFTDLTTALNGKIEPSVDNIITALTGWTSGWFKAALILYIAYQGVLIMAGKSGSDARAIMFTCVKMAVSLVLATQAAAYNFYFKDILLNGIPNEVSGAISGALGSMPITGTVFDHTMAKVFIVGLVVWKHLPWDASGIAMGIFVLLFWTIACVSVCFAYIVWETSHVFLELMIAVGPIFVGMILFAPLRPMFEKWLAVVFGFILTQVFIVALLTILVSAETQNLSWLVTNVSEDPITQLGLVLSAIALFVICGIIAYSVPGTASSIAGGVHFHGGAAVMALAGYALGKAAAAVPGGGGGGPPPPPPPAGGGGGGPPPPPGGAAAAGEPSAPAPAGPSLSGPSGMTRDHDDPGPSPADDPSDRWRFASEA